MPKIIKRPRQIKIKRAESEIEIEKKAEQVSKGSGKERERERKGGNSVHIREIKFILHKQERNRIKERETC